MNKAAHGCFHWRCEDLQLLLTLSSSTEDAHTILTTSTPLYTIYGRLHMLRNEKDYDQHHPHNVSKVV